MSSIQKRIRNGRVGYRVHFRAPDGRQRSKTFDRLIPAQRFQTTIDASKLTGSYVDPARGKVTVGDVAAQHLAAKVNLKATTRARVEGIIAVHVVPRWGQVPVAAVEFGGVQAWVASLIASGLSPGSVRKTAGVLSGILALAVKDRRIAVNPAADVDLPRAAKRSKRYLTAAQVAGLAAAAGDRGRLAVLTLSYTGLRWGELIGLRVKRVDLLRRRLTIAEAMVEVNGQLTSTTPKTHESRSVPIPRFLVNELAVHLAGKGPDELVFTTPTGAPLRNRGARRQWFDAAAASIGVAGLTPHELRHTAASLAVSAGANVKAVQRMLGHASAAMTLDVYSDLFDDDLDAVAERLDEIARRVAPALPEAPVVDLDAARQASTGQ
jgi:integrase